MKGGKDSRNITETILFLWQIALRSRDALKCLSGFFTENTVHEEVGTDGNSPESWYQTLIALIVIGCELEP